MLDLPAGRASIIAMVWHPRLLISSGIPLLVLAFGSCGGRAHIDGNADTDADASDSLEEADMESADADVDEDPPPCLVDPDCDDLDPCTSDSCDSSTGHCSHSPTLVDGDLDGFMNVECFSGTDCDDGQAEVHPCAFEVCGDGIDQDCDGMVDELLSAYGETRISFNDTDSVKPTIAWTGSEFGIAWRDGAVDLDECEIRFVVVTADGGVVSDDTLVSSLVCDQQWTAPSAQWTGSEFGIVWRNMYAFDTPSYFVRLDGTGLEIGDDVILQNTSGVIQADVSIAWTGSLYGMVYSHPELMFDTLSMEGIISNDIKVLDEGGGYAFPSLAWTGAGFGVAFYYSRATDFAVLDADGDRLPDSWYPNWYWLTDNYPEVAWSGMSFGLVWDAGGSVACSVLDPVGELLGPIEYIGGGVLFQSRKPCIVWTNDFFGIAWEDSRDGTGENVEVYMTAFPAVGPVSEDHFRITSDINASLEPSLTWTGSEFGVAWQDDRDGNQEIYFTRVSVCP